MGSSVSRYDIVALQLIIPQLLAVGFYLPLPEGIRRITHLWQKVAVLAGSPICIRLLLRI